MKKVLICNQSAVKNKYGSNAEVFWLQMERLIAAGSRMGQDTELICVDDTGSMGKYGLQPVLSALDEKQNKEAVDGIFQKIKPDSAVLIGAHDIIPFQLLENQLPNEDEKFIPSDLPYACNNGYSKHIADFLKPDRRVTRLPDLYGSSKDTGMADFIKTVDSAIATHKASRAEYSDTFCLSAETWEKQTESVVNSLRLTGSIYLSPPIQTPLEHSILRHPLHFINLHGGKLKAELYGEDRNGFYKALSSSDITAGIRESTVAVVLSCFGAQLFYQQGGIPIANAYLSSGAVMLGSTAASYTEEAEKFGKQFMENFRSSNTMTMQQAFLKTRIDYLSSFPILSPYKQNTAAEFVFYGDCGESYLTKEMQESIQKRIAHMEAHTGVAVLSRDQEVPQEIAAQIEQKRIQENHTGQSEIRVFDVLSLKGEEQNPQFAHIKQYTCSLQDGEYSRRHVLYTTEHGRIVEVKEYTEK